MSPSVISQDDSSLKTHKKKKTTTHVSALTSWYDELAAARPLGRYSLLKGHKSLLNVDLSLYLQTLPSITQLTPTFIIKLLSLFFRAGTLVYNLKVYSTAEFTIVTYLIFEPDFSICWIKLLCSRSPFCAELSWLSSCIWCLCIRQYPLIHLQGYNVGVH